jgi:hypothetical protein
MFSVGKCENRDDFGEQSANRRMITQLQFIGIHALLDNLTESLESHFDITHDFRIALMDVFSDIVQDDFPQVHEMAGADEFGRPITGGLDFSFL